MTHRYILDTNVIVNAQGDRSPQTATACIEKCQYLLYRCLAGEFNLVLDVGQHGSDVLAEYQQQFHHYQGGYGEVFIRWLLNQLGQPQIIEIPITKTDQHTYEEFPHEDARLRTFDPSDRKWIALAVAHFQYFDASAPIMQSADLKWKDYQIAFLAHHVDVQFMCEE
ncbi:MAG UNVERIFIED_CONTAM: PIN domain-containing protein [Anaerolineae bacterium]